MLSFPVANNVTNNNTTVTTTTTTSPLTRNDAIKQIGQFSIGSLSLQWINDESLTRFSYSFNTTLDSTSRIYFAFAFSYDQTMV